MHDDIPAVAIGGTALSPAQRMTLSVALNNFRIEMSDPTALGDDEHGRELVELYKIQLDSMLLMLGRASLASTRKDL